MSDSGVPSPLRGEGVATATGEGDAAKIATAEQYVPLSHPRIESRGTLPLQGGGKSAAWPPAVVLERNGIRLEPLTLAHEAGLRDATADGELWTLPTTVPSPGKEKEYIETAHKMRAEGSRLPFAVIDIDSGRVLGSTSYHDIVAPLKRVEIGYTWYRKSVWRGPVNTTCKLMLMQHAFETLQCPVVGWRTGHKNSRSQRAIEALGAKRDGVIRAHALYPDGSIRDTVIYSMLASEWPDAKAKLESRLASGGFEPKQADRTIRFVEIDAENLVKLHRLNAGAVGSRMVAPNGMSVAQAAYSKNAWPRAVYVGDVPVGFVMLFDPTLDPANAEKEELPIDALYVWRLMIDFKHQGKGYGEQVLRAVIAMARERRVFKRVTLSYVMEDGSAKPFYEKLGFRDTGKIDDGEMEMSLDLQGS
jgi:N-acetyltransferase